MNGPRGCSASGRVVYAARTMPRRVNKLRFSHAACCFSAARRPSVSFRSVGEVCMPPAAAKTHIMRVLRASSCAQEVCRLAFGNRLASRLPNQVDSGSHENTGFLNLNGPRGCSASRRVVYAARAMPRRISNLRFSDAACCFSAPRSASISFKSVGASLQAPRGGQNANYTSVARAQL